jgi:hypothetical protein
MTSINGMFAHMTQKYHTHKKKRSSIVIKLERQYVMQFSCNNAFVSVRTLKFESKFLKTKSNQVQTS